MAEGLHAHGPTVQEPLSPRLRIAANKPHDASGLFSENTTPGHHYLIETDPALTGMALFSEAGSG